MINRRQYLQTCFSGSLVLLFPKAVRSAFYRLDTAVKLGLIADLHQDLIHDGLERLRGFVHAMKEARPDATVQLGDFAIPKAENEPIINLFNQSSRVPLHVIGNHDTDSGFTKAQCIAMWGMPARYYAKDVQGIRLLVLDGNETGSPKFKGGYASYIGVEQRNWLQEALASATGPVIVCSHQPLAGPLAVDDADEVQRILGEFPKKVLLAINGHSHVDYLTRIQGIPYLHLNSASYFWVGEKYRHATYSAEIMEKYPFAALTCPYRDSLFAILTVDPANQVIRLKGRQSSWVGPSPAQLGSEPYPDLFPGGEIAAHIRHRDIG
jgi:Icc protein